MIHRCLSNGCAFDDESGELFIVCPVCGYDLDGAVKAVDVPGDETLPTLDMDVGDAL
jgi:predicted  nucleic acid-binding Zn-ribbon protein